MPDLHVLQPTYDAVEDYGRAYVEADFTRKGGLSVNNNLTRNLAPEKPAETLIFGYLALFGQVPCTKYQDGAKFWQRLEVLGMMQHRINYLFFRNLFNHWHR